MVLAQPNSFPETDVVLKLGRKLRIPIELVPTKQFLVPRDEFRDWASGQRRLVMENHYRRVRQRFGWLMDENGKPVGGAWNYDAENRLQHLETRRRSMPQHTSPGGSGRNYDRGDADGRT
ncbi:MAG: cryptochrome/photolyase family protein [Chthoniobacterales bacterium]|nr:cryptochrome/photolyase family protein [Chthoniobacterales bacterium]